MCIIAHSPVGKPIPSEQYRKNMFDHNDDGAGFAYIKDGVVHWEKGFMNFVNFEEALERVSSTVDLTQCDIVMHFRIGTHGGNTPQNTHPFIVSNDYEDMRKLTGKTKKTILFHNGIINSVEVPNKVSDTMAWIHERLYYLMAYDRNCINNPLIQDMILKDIGSSKLALVSGKGVLRLGSFIEGNDGCFYSNSTYSYPVSYPTYSGYYSGGWGNSPTTVYRTFYKLAPEDKECIFIETVSDVYDVLDVDQNIYIHPSGDVLIEDNGNFVSSNISIVDKNLLKLTYGQLYQMRALDFKSSHIETTLEYGNCDARVPWNSKITAVYLRPQVDELWDVMDKKVYAIKTAKKAIITEDDDVFLLNTDGKWHFMDCVVATHQKNDKWEETTFDKLYNFREVVEIDECDVTYV